MSSKKKGKQILIEEYIETYCQEKRIRGRYAVYISPETHRNLKKTVQLFKSKYHVTTSSIADSIVSHHIETHREILNDAHKEYDREFYEWLKEKRQTEGDGEESEFGQEEDRSV